MTHGKQTAPGARPTCCCPTGPPEGWKPEWRALPSIWLYEFQHWFATTFVRADGVDRPLCNPVFEAFDRWLWKRCDRAHRSPTEYRRRWALRRWRLHFRLGAYACRILGHPRPLGAHDHQTRDEWCLRCGTVLRRIEARQ